MSTSFGAAILTFFLGFGKYMPLFAVLYCVHDE